MRVIICGSRDWTDKDTIREVIRELPIGAEIVHGACRGADMLAEQICEEWGMSSHQFPANWSLGRKAGPIRNQKMLDEGADLVLAFHEDIENSKGTKHMVGIARKKGVEVRVYTGKEL